MIDKHSFLPAYLQIEQYLTKLMDTNVLKPGDILPSETVLAEQFKVSRMTARKAVDYLARQKRVVRKQGLGSFVLESNVDLKMELPLDKHLTSSEVAKFLSQPIENKVVDFYQETADEVIANQLKIPSQSKVWVIKRLRLIAQIPFVYEISFLEKARFNDLTMQILEKSKYDYFLQKGIKIKKSKKIFSAVIPISEIRSHLNLHLDEPVIMAKSTAFDKTDIPVEISNVYYNQAYYTFELTSIRE